MSSTMRHLARLLCLGVAACTSTPVPPALRLGTTYTVQQSGALTRLDSLWRGPRVATVIGPSGQVLQAAARGDLDVVLTHAPTLEERLLVRPGHAALRCPLAASRFAIVGPAADSAGVATAAGAVEAFARIAQHGGGGGGAGRGGGGGGGPPGFVSRGDSSGTHVRELALWAAAGVRPARQRWYTESGTDQAATLRLADERNAYALADLPTLSRLAGMRLRVLLTADTLLRNPYTLYVVRSQNAPILARAEHFAEWAMGPWRAALLAQRLPDGSPAFERQTAGDSCTALPSPPPS
jgi:tungstate transport system substrate-binding protein